jgi:hypothetical protein
MAAKKVKFGKNPKGKKAAGGGTDFNFGANVKAKGGKKRKGGFGGGS